MTESNELKVAGLLLAAGGSTRLGRPKQLVEFQGKTLIRRAAQALIDAGCSPVVAVLGAEVELSQREVEELGVEVVVNAAWASGMGSSIAFGMGPINSVDPQPDAVLISVCDQPFVTAEKLSPFIETFDRSRVDVVAARYKDIAGVPALFSKTLFPRLLDLKGDNGAREIIRNSPDAMTIPLPDAGIDVDTVDDVAHITSHI